MSKRINRGIAILILILIVILGWSVVTLRTPPPSLTIGIPLNEQSALILIAEDQKFFAQNGLHVTVKTFDTALAAINALKNHEIDLAESAEYPIVTQAFANTDLSIIASIDKFYNVFLVARKDAGIETAMELKGKKIGVAKGTLTEFYLGRFLELQGLKLQEVTLVNLPFSQAADALARREVDAFQVQNKDLPQIKERLGNHFIAWKSQSGQAGFEVLSGRTDWITRSPAVIIQVLKALKQAEEYCIDHPSEALAIIQKKLRYDDAYMTTLPAQHQYALTLDRSLILAMEDEARWMIKNNLIATPTMPDFAKHIYLDGLQAIKPGAVNIVR